MTAATPARVPWPCAWQAVRLALVKAWLGSGVAGVLMLGPSLHMLQVYDRVLLSRSEGTLLVVSLLTVGLAVGLAAMEWLRSRWLIRTGLELDRRLSGVAWEASFPTPGEGRAHQGTATPLADLTEVRQFLTGPHGVALLELPWSPLFLLALWVLHPVLGGVAVAFMLLQVAVAHRGQKGAAEQVQAARRAQADLQHGWTQTLALADVAATQGVVPQMVQRWLARARLAEVRNAPGHLREQRFASLGKGLRYAQQSLSLALGAWLVVRGELSVGSMVAANVLMARALAPIDHLAAAWRPMWAARQAYGRLEHALEPVRVPTGQEESARSLVDGVRTGVELRQVSVRVPGCDVLLFEGLNLALRPGSVTVLVGPSGAGKSTLARVVLGLWPVEAGQRLHDADLSGAAVGYLPQAVELFAGSFADNIARMAEPDAEQVIEAARCVGLHETLLRFPQGYDTPAGVAGHLLSAGQRQRLALARAVYGEPRLLVLDEPDAHLDEEGERALAQTLVHMRGKGCALLLVTHRLAMMGLADHIWRVQHGRLWPVPHPASTTTTP